MDYAHLRGIKVGIGAELSDVGNLQQSFDLIHRTELAGDTVSVMATRLAQLVGEIAFDRVGISFGEFFGTDPAAFVAQIDNAYSALKRVGPQIEMAATVHVGNAPSQRVEYQGQSLPYYFLVQFANPAIVPWVHTVMYYNLFEDAGGAYLHDDFALHRQFLLDRLKNKQRVAYYPEAAYWVAFDNSVPTYLPVYLYSRWLDQARVAERVLDGGDALKGHMLFSSGWEWGYWQNDYYTLRTNFELPSRWEQPIEEMFAPYGAKGAQLAAQIAALAMVQHDALILRRLAPYLAGRDFLIEGGDVAGVVAQPRRPSFAEVTAMTPADRSAFANTALSGLDQLAADTEAIGKTMDAIGLSDDDPWYAEVRDGVGIDAARARHIAALYRATVVQADGGQPTETLTAADAAFAEGQRLVARRRARFHDPTPARLVAPGPNATLYQYGYLQTADTLYFWVRERAQVHNLFGAHEDVPGCVLGY